MARLSSEELTRRYGNLLMGYFVVVDSCYYRSWAATCANCFTEINSKQHRILYCGPDETVSHNCVRIHVCRSYAACERRRIANG